MKIIIPPIKSQGIKTKLVPSIMSAVPSFSGRWIEPFLGTGVVAFNSEAQKALLSDINPHIISFYQKLHAREITPQHIREYLYCEGEKLKEAAGDGSIYYKTVRNRFNTTYNVLDFLFLSRTGFNGMIRFNKNGQWNIPFCKKQQRFSKSYITKIVHQAENCLSRMTDDWVFKNKDFREILVGANNSDFIYCDPPYAGRYTDYYSGWSEEDEHDLFELLKATKAKFILSSWHHNDFRYNDNIKKYEENFHVITQEHFYHAGAKEKNRKPIVEALVMNYTPVYTEKKELQGYLFPD
ncbi:MAG: DNA adenine methylase [Treponema sp.]|uniref:DNA adenine methylase n=1 Tax=Treponema sp. TaxID=166 RepID=UPI003FA2368B